MKNLFDFKFCKSIPLISWSYLWSDFHSLENIYIKESMNFPPFHKWWKITKVIIDSSNWNKILWINIHLYQLMKIFVSEFWILCPIFWSFLRCSLNLVPISRVNFPIGISPNSSINKLSVVLISHSDFFVSLVFSLINLVLLEILNLRKI